MVYNGHMATMATVRALRHFVYNLVMPAGPAGPINGSTHFIGVYTRVQRCRSKAWSKRLCDDPSGSHISGYQCAAGKLMCSLGSTTTAHDPCQPKASLLQPQRHIGHQSVPCWAHLQQLTHAVWLEVFVDLLEDDGRIRVDILPALHLQHFNSQALGSESWLAQKINLRLVVVIIYI